MIGLARQLRDWIESNGHGTYEGYTNGGHIRYRLSDGSAYITGATPSKPSALINAKADVRRQLGLKSESPNAAKYSRRPQQQGFSMEGTRRTDSSLTVEWLQAELDGVDAALLSLNPRREPDRARRLAKRRLELADMLRRMYQPVVPVVAP